MRRRPRRSWSTGRAIWRLILTLGALLLLALGGGLIVLHTPWFGHWAARALAATASELTGEEVVIGDLKVDLPRRSLSLDGVVVSHRTEDGGPAEVALAVERTRVVLGIRRGAPRIARLEIERPAIHLHLDADGLREFRELRGEEASATEGGAAGRLRELPWDELQLSHAMVVLDGPDWRLALDDLSLIPGEDGLLSDLTLGALQVRLGEVEQQSDPVRLTGVQLGPDRVVVPRFAIDLPVGAIEGSFAAVLAGPLEGDLSLTAHLEEVDALLKTPAGLQGAVYVDAELGGTLEAPEVEGALALDGARRIDPRNGDPIDPGNLRGPWRLEGQQIQLGPLRAEWGSGLVELVGGIDLGTTGTHLTVLGEGLHLDDSLRRFGASPHPWVDFEGDVELHLAGTLSPLRLVGSEDVAMRQLVVTAGPVDSMSSDRLLAMPLVRLLGSLEVGPAAVRIVANRVSSRRSAGRADALLRYADGGSLDLWVDLPTLDLSEIAPMGDIGLGGTAHVTGRLEGPFRSLAWDGQIEAHNLRVFDLPFADLASGPIRSPELKNLDFPDLRAIRGDSHYNGQIRIDFEEETRLDLLLFLQRARIADITGIFLDLPQVDGEVDGNIVLNGSVHALDGEIGLQFQGVDLFGERFDNGELSAWMDEGRFTMDSAVLRRAGGSESLLARGSVGAGWALNMELLSGGVQLQRADRLRQLDTDLRGDLSLDSRIGGTLFEPEPHGRLALRDTWLMGHPVGDSTLFFDTADGQLDFEGAVAGLDLGVEGRLSLWEEPGYQLLATFDDFPIEQLYPVAADGSPVEGGLTGTLALSGDLGEGAAPFHLVLEGSQAWLAWRDQRLETEGPWHFEQEGPAFRLKGLSLAGGRTQVAFGGRKDADGGVMFAGGGEVDLDLLRSVVPGLQLAQGMAHVDLSLAGRKGEISPVIEVSTTGARLRGEWFPETLDDVSARITARPDGYSLQSLSGRIGGGTLRASGDIEAEEWRPLRYDLEGELHNARVRYLDFLPPMTGNARLSFDGPASEPLLSGTIDILDMTFAERIDWEEWVLAFAGDRLRGSAAEERADLFSLDLHIKGEDSIHVRNNVGDFAASADLEVVGDTRRPGLIGEVRAQPGGQAYLKEREFEVQRMEVRFLDPYTYDPDLDVSLQTSVRTREEEYQIETRVTGPYSNWRTETRSDPDLPQADVNALLLFGMTREELERSGMAGALAVEGADLLVSSLGVTDSLARVGGGIFQLDVVGEDLLRIDRIDLVSGLDERGSGSVSSELRLLVEGELPWWKDSSLVVEQNMIRTSDTYLGLEKRLARRLYARTFWAREQEGRYLPVGGAYGLDIRIRLELD